MIGREPELPAGEADAAALRQSGDPNGRARSARDHAAAVRECRVDAEEVRPGPAGRPSVRRERDGVQPRDVDDHAARRGVAAVAVPA